MPKKDLSTDEFRKKYPHLSSELEEGEGANEEGLLDEELEGEVQGEEGATKKEAIESSGYEPSVMDFLARCDTDKQALEIIDYMERRGEISKDQAESLRLRLKENGVHSFGQKRGSDHYNKKFIR
jgi:hypothetical protein